MDINCDYTFLLWYLNCYCFFFLYHPIDIVAAIAKNNYALKSLSIKIEYDDIFKLQQIHTVTEEEKDCREIINLEYAMCNLKKVLDSFNKVSTKLQMVGLD